MFFLYFIDIACVFTIFSGDGKLAVTTKNSSPTFGDLKSAQKYIANKIPGKEGKFTISPEDKPKLVWSTRNDIKTLIHTIKTNTENQVFGFEELGDGTSLIRNREIDCLEFDIVDEIFFRAGCEKTNEFQKFIINGNVFG